MNQFLIPANSKRGQLIFNIFRPVDFIIEGIGVVLTLILFLIIQPGTLLLSLVVLFPASVTTFLVLPIGNYHNVLCFLQNVYHFYFGNESNQLKWKGWCAKDEYK